VRKKAELLKGCSEGNSDTARCRKGACKGKTKIKKKNGNV
jgi:hypothetical protein